MWLQEHEELLPAPCPAETTPAPRIKRMQRRNASYQKKNLERKFASSTGDFCILSAPPVWFLCTWVVFVRVAHICGSPERLRSHRQRGGGGGVLACLILHRVPPVDMMSLFECLVSLSSVRLPGPSGSLCPLLSCPLLQCDAERTVHPLWARQNVQRRTSFPRRRASGCILWQQAEEAS